MDPKERQDAAADNNTAPVVQWAFRCGEDIQGPAVAADAVAAHEKPVVVGCTDLAQEVHLALAPICH